MEAGDSSQKKVTTKSGDENLITLTKKLDGQNESTGKFDVWETRFFLLLLSQIQDGDDEHKSYQIWYRDLIKQSEVMSEDLLEDLEDGLKNLMRKRFRLICEEVDLSREFNFLLLRSVDLRAGENEDNKEYIEVTVDDVARSTLLEIQKSFAPYDPETLKGLRGYPYDLLSF